MDSLIDGGMFRNDRVSEYYCFTELFQEILQHQLSGSEKTFRNATMPFARVFSRYGVVLVDLRRYEEAGSALEKSLRWNPVDADIMFEYAETFKLRGNMERFYELTREAFRIAYRPASLARCYRNLGYYFTEKRLWNVAASCILMSLQYAPDDKNAVSELFYIEHMAGKAADQVNFEDFKRFSEQYDLPIGADDVILDLAAQFGKHFLNEGNNDLAAYFLTIFYDLTDDEQVKTILEQIS
jgi:tetratricopeptide (TPR) repeat protein